MSFDIQEYRSIVDVRDIVDLTKGSSFEQDIDYMIERIQVLISDNKNKGLMGDLKGIFDKVKKDSLLINFDEDVGGRYILSYCKVSTQGPIVGFLGFYVDLASGYVLLNGQKEEEYIPLFSMLNYIEGHFRLKEGSISITTFKWAVEQYKLNQITIFEMFSEIVRGDQTKAGNGARYFIESYFREKGLEKTGFTMSEDEFKTQTERVLRELRSVTSFVGIIGEKFQSIAKNFGNIEYTGDRLREFVPKDPTKSLRRFRELAGDEFYEMMLGISSYYDKQKKVRLPEHEYPKDSRNKEDGDRWQTWRRNEDRIHEDSLLHSSMIDREFFMRKDDNYKRVKKSEVIAMNFLDLVETTEEPYGDIMDMSREENFDGLKELTKRLGVEDIVKGAKLTAIKRGMGEDILSGTVAVSLRLKPPVFQVQASLKSEDTYLGHYDKKYITLSKYVDRIGRKLEKM